MRNLCLALVVATACAWTMVTVKPVSWAPDAGRRVCIEANPVLIDPDLPPEMLSGVARKPS